MYGMHTILAFAFPYDQAEGSKNPPVTSARPPRQQRRTRDDVDAKNCRKGNDVCITGCYDVPVAPYAEPSRSDPEGRQASNQRADTQGT